MHRRDLKVGDAVIVRRPYSQDRRGTVWIMHSDDRRVWVLLDDDAGAIGVMPRDLRRPTA